MRQTISRLNDQRYDREIADADINRRTVTTRICLQLIALRTSGEVSLSEAGILWFDSTALELLPKNQEGAQLTRMSCFGFATFTHRHPFRPQ